MDGKIVALRAERENDSARLVPAGPFDLAHAAAVARAVASVEPQLEGCRSIDLDLAGVDRLDGAGATLLATLLNRLDETGRLARIGHTAADLPRTFAASLDVTGHFIAALPKALASPRSVDWRVLPKLVQDIGADALVVTSAANLLVGLIIGFLGVSQLARFGAIAFVPELVVVAQFRELAPLVTAIVVAGRSGAGLASEIATMKVSEEIDALRVMGFDPMRWLVVPRCLAIVAVVPVLTWIGDVTAIAGGLLATTAITDMTPRAYLLATADAITPAHLLAGLIKTPFLALAIGLIACGQGLATQGGAAAVGARTTTAVVLAIFGVIVIDAAFTLLYAAMGV